MTGKKRRSTRGQTLLELIAATTIISLTLVPGLGMMRDSLRFSREIEMDTLMATLAVDRLEEYLAKTSAVWQTTDPKGNYFEDGYPNFEQYPDLEYKVFRSHDIADGGSPNSLMVIRTTVWNDTIDNDEPDASERKVVFATKLARVVSYEYEASGP